MKKLTTQEFIEKARQIHEDKYDYSKVEYKGMTQKITIICPKHGEFEQRAGDHINKGSNCPKCSKNLSADKQKSNTNDFIKKARQVHGNKYNYDSVEYKNAKTKVIIKCPIHGNFEQTPNNHLNGQGCPLCAKEKQIVTQTYSKQDFIKKASLIHNNKYNYIYSNYINSREKVLIICPIHGPFQQIPNNHLRGAGCPKCGFEESVSKRTKSLNDFIQQASKKHNNYYSYSKSQYTGCFEKVVITCPIHGDFLQRAYAHLSGQGCPECNKSKGEKLIENFLQENRINYIFQYEVEIDPNINSSGFAYIDFYLPDYDVFIEYNGIQHYKYIPHFHKGGIVDFEKQLERDNYIRNVFDSKLIEFSYKLSEQEIINKLNEIIRN